MTESHEKALKYRWSLPRGRIVRRVLRDDPGQEYLTYVPTTGAAEAPMLVSVHGISRNAHQQALMFAPYCERFGVVLVVPRFTPDQHDDYQRLGRKGRGQRADLAAEKCVAEVAFLTGADGTQFNLFGYSGGAQFAHRYLMAHPHRVTKAVVVAAGWYTLPDHKRRYPYGIRSSRSLPDVIFNPEEFLHVPVEVMVGEKDVTAENLRQTEGVTKAQGETRIERAYNWVTAMEDAGKAYGISTDIQFTLVPQVDHSFARFCRRGALVKRVFKSLFDVAIQPGNGAQSGDEGLAINSAGADQAATSQEEAIARNQQSSA